MSEKYPKRVCAEFQVTKQSLELGGTKIATLAFESAFYKMLQKLKEDKDVDWDRILVRMCTTNPDDERAPIGEYISSNANHEVEKK